jgi:nitrogen fixation protein FixH
LDLPKGKWMMQVEAIAADGTAFRQRIDLYVKG